MSFGWFKQMPHVPPRKQTALNYSFYSKTIVPGLNIWGEFIEMERISIENHEIPTTTANARVSEFNGKIFGICKKVKNE